ncbi:hypothetical protein LXL04_011148 [Taraxacum kok-saghyz]
MEEDQERSCKRARHYTYLMPMGENEEERECYQKKLNECYEEKRKKFATRDAIAVDQVNEREKRKKRRIVAKKKSQSVPIESNEVTRRLKEYIVNEENGTEVKMVIQKTLYQTDLEKSQNRLNMPINQLQTLEFLREDEKRILDNEKEIEVGLLGPRLKMHEKSMMLRKWRMRSTYNYVLKTNWNNFVKENEKDLQKNSKIQVWSFRKKERLHFAIACLERDVDQQNDADHDDVDFQNDADVPPFFVFL